MAEKKLVEGHCPNCGARRADVVAECEDESPPSPDYFTKTDYQILKCGGCGEHYFKSTSSNSEEYRYYYDEEAGMDALEFIKTINYWPPVAKRQQPEWAIKITFKDKILGSLFNDVYTAFNNNLGVLAAIGMRTVFERASKLLDVDTNNSFKKITEDLKTGGHITSNEMEVLTALVEAGNAAVHRGWKPEPKQLDAMLIILETFLHRAFLLEGIGAELKGIPERPPREKKKKPA